MTRRSATLFDVAQAAGVSQQTVSRVLNNPSIVSARTQEKVVRAMQILRYVPNRSAQLLAGKSMPGIGLISTSLTLHAPSQIAAAIQRYADDQRLQVAMSMPKTADLTEIQSALNEFRAQHIQGVIINQPLDNEQAEQLSRDNPDLECLFLDVPPECEVSSLRFDHHFGAKACIAHLVELGHRDFGLLAGPESAVSARLRLTCWRDALHQAGIPQALTVYGDWSAQSGWNCTLELLRLNPRISAIVVGNDQMALGVLSALATLHRDGVSVTGYDDTADSLYYQPALTTVQQNFDQLGKQAITTVMDMCATPGQRHKRVLPVRLIVRQSTAKKSIEASREETIQQLKALITRL